MSTGVIRNINSVPTSPVQMAGVNGAEMAIMVGREHGAPNFALRHFRVTPGGNTPRHSHDYEHEVFIVEGGGTVLLNGSEQPVRSGDVIYVPANQEHQFKADTKAGLRFLCLVPVTRDCGDPTPGS
ncbi:MAG: cupin domain-containing protein [Phycisphaerae bacterium]|nr:cupin domain-containing protein [Phycisphaerae bacterium]MBN8596583.1 cupin domain-containing protein [Planctomycetota bacterium]